MESTYIFYPVKRAIKVLQTANWPAKGYIPVQFDQETNTITLRKNYLLFRKVFFEIRVVAIKENISSVSAEQVFTTKAKEALEQRLIQDILKLF